MAQKYLRAPRMDRLTLSRLWRSTQPLLEVEHEDQIPVNAGHSLICKFEVDGDDTFEKAWKRIKRMREEPPSANAAHIGA